MRLSSASHQLILLSCLLLLLSAFTSGVISHDSKPKTCCRKYEKNAHFKIQRCYILPETDKCLNSVVFTDPNNRNHCYDPTAPWMTIRMNLLKKNNIPCKDYTKS